MPAQPCACPPVRPAAVVNAEIRRLAAGASWTPEALARLAELRAEWQAAVEAEDAA